ncbi:MAG: 30S ribosomal protein S16 [Candidatus Omnitrophica bacterium]|jgi:small subunit ribosomal protein S16|nr:30S ribosomal protein S16 [Candidatus Omnitrophota bacterium]
MAVHIRLRRIGKNPKGKAHFRVTAFDERSGRDARVLEELGYYDSITGKSLLKKELIQAWIKNGAQMSDTVKSLMKKASK